MYISTNETLVCFKILHIVPYMKGNDEKIFITPNYDHSNKSGMGVTAMNIFGTSMRSQNT